MIFPGCMKCSSIQLNLFYHLKYIELCFVFHGSYFKSFRFLFLCRIMNGVSNYLNKWKHLQKLLIRRRKFRDLGVSILRGNIFSCWILIYCLSYQSFMQPWWDNYSNNLKQLAMEYDENILNHFSKYKWFSANICET